MATSVVVPLASPIAARSLTLSGASITLARRGPLAAAGRRRMGGTAQGVPRWL